MKTIVLSCILFCFSITAQASEEVPIQIKAQDKQFTVPLVANPTTGFQWKVVSYNPKFLKLVSSRYQPPQTNRIGAGGQMLFTFDLKKAQKHPNTLHILFKYARPWEASGGTMKKVTVRIQ